MGNTNHKGYESVETYDETNKLNQTDSNVYNNKHKIFYFSIKILIELFF